MNKTVGIIGLGIMGGAIARNLIARGWTVHGHDVDTRRMRELESSGATIASGVGAVAKACPRIMTSLPSATAALSVAQAIAAAGERRVVLELSTLAIADKLGFQAILEAAGCTALDCPLSGTGAQARERDLVVYASGEPDEIDACSDLFADFSKRWANLGVYGNGSRMKFVANHLVAIHNVAAAEAMALALRAGLDLQAVVDAVGPGAGGSRMFQMRAPMMATGVYEPATMRVSTWDKDMAVIAAFAEELHCPVPLFAATRPVYAEALRRGFGDQDTASVFEVMKADAPDDPAP